MADAPIVSDAAASNMVAIFMRLSPYLAEGYC